LVPHQRRPQLGLLVGLLLLLLPLLLPLGCVVG
jgi:hypothetical protein